MSIGIEAATPLAWFTKGYDYDSPQQVARNFCERMRSVFGVTLDPFQNTSYWSHDFRPSGYSDLNDELEKHGKTIFLGEIHIPGTFSDAQKLILPDYDDGEIVVSSTESVRNALLESDKVLLNIMPDYKETYGGVIEAYLEGLEISERNKAPIWWIY